MIIHVLRCAIRSEGNKEFTQLIIENIYYSKSLSPVYFMRINYQLYLRLLCVLFEPPRYRYRELYLANYTFPFFQREIIQKAPVTINLTKIIRFSIEIQRGQRAIYIMRARHSP